jgi:hypothetical protein
MVASHGHHVGISGLKHRASPQPPGTAKCIDSALLPAGTTPTRQKKATISTEQIQAATINKGLIEGVHVGAALRRLHLRPLEHHGEEKGSQVALNLTQKIPCSPSYWHTANNRHTTNDRHLAENEA